MSTQATAPVRVVVAPAKPKPVVDKERAHRVRLYLGYLLATALVAGIFAYGFNYYTLSAADRPFSPKHEMLKPSGSVGVKLGMFGLAMFLVIFLYPLRKKWAWLGKQGSSRHWLDNHVLLGIAAPFVIALHAAFKFRGFAGMAFWIMFAVSVSGIVGRYLYGQIPRNLKAAQLTQKELQELHQKFAGRLTEQQLISEADLRALLTLPSRERIQGMNILSALGYM